jgi:hypothetical protein
MKQGMVYRIIHLHSNLVYVGSTFQKRLSDRWMNHKRSFKQYLKGNYSCVSIYPYFEKYGIENFKIILIKNYQVCDRLHLQAYEQLWMNKLNCLNKNSAFQPLKRQYYKQYQKNYRQDNKDKIALIEKKYRDNNKQKIKQYKKQYREKNKDRIKQYREKNKDRIKQYYEKNKEIVALKGKFYYENNKEKITEKNKIKSYCYDCDTYIRKNDIKKHYKTIKHLTNCLPVGL